MNFDDLQQQWKDEPSDNVQIPSEIDVLKKAITPIDFVRSSMKRDFLIQTFLRILILFVPVFFDFTDSLKTIFYTLYFTILFFVIYYYYKFYTFYKNSYNLNYNSRKNLSWFYYELKLNIELLKACSFIDLLLTGILGVTIGWFIRTEKQHNTHNILNLLDGVNPLFINIGLAIFAFLMFLHAEKLPNISYGKYLKNIKTVLDELDEL